MTPAELLDAVRKLDPDAHYAEMDGRSILVTNIVKPGVLYAISPGFLAYGPVVDEP